MKAIIKFTVFVFGHRTLTRLRGKASRARLIFAPAVVLLIGTILLTSGSGFAAQTYLITDLGALSGGSSSAAAINNDKQVAGTSSTGTGYDAFLVSNGTMRDLGNLGGNSSAAGLNARGDVVGSSTTSTSSNVSHPFLFRNGVLTDLGIPAGFNTGVANGVNDADQVVGEFISGPRRHTVGHAFLFQNGGFKDLGTLGGSSASASGISNSGQIIGSSVNASGQSHAFLFQNGTMMDLGTLPGGFSSGATAINDAGQIVGSSSTANFGPSHAVIFQNGVVTDLGVPVNFTSSAASAINIHSVVVGTASVGSYGRNNHAFVAQNGNITDLNRLIPGNSGPWILQTATGLNDAGQIVGTGTNNGVQRAFLLTPTNGPTVPASPINLVANSGNAVVALSWDSSVGATSYNVKRANSSSGPFASIASANTTSFTDRSVVNCSTYNYAVAAVNSAGESPNSSPVTGAPQSVPPAPSKLTAQPDHNPNLFLGSAIDLAWQNNAGNCSEFVIVERSTDGVNFQTLATYGNLQTTATDGFLNSGTRYFYRVRAQSNGGESGPSNIASAVAP